MIQTTRSSRRISIGAVALALAALFALPLHAAPSRIVTWNMQPREISGAAPALLAAGVNAEAAQVLKNLNPDVIVLQQVPDSDACDALIQALRPAEYQLAVLSSFRDPQTGMVTREQTAILSRVKATSPAFDTWKTAAQTPGAPGGYASAIIHFPNRNVAVFAVQLGGVSSVIDVERESLAQQSAREDAARQLVQQVDALRDSPEAVQSVVVAGDFNTTVNDPKLSGELTLTRLERAGFASAFADLPPEKRVTLPGYGTQADATLDYIYTRDAGKPANVRVLPVNTTLHYPVTGDLDFGSPAVVAAAPPVTSSTDAGAAASTGFFQAFAKQVGPANVGWMAGLLFGGLGCIVAGFLLLGRRAQSLRAISAAGPGVLSPANAGEILVMARATQTGSAVRTTSTTESAPVVHVQGAGQTQPGTEADAWRLRAEAAEQRAERSAGVVREGLMQQLGQWLKIGVARQLVSDRQQLIEAQHAAALKMQAVDQRLTKVEQQIQLRMREYEFRITELERELVAAREENRELIRAKIAQVRAEMERERQRMLQDAQAN